MSDLSPTAEIPLDFPVTIDGEKVSMLTMRRPKLADTQAARKKAGDDFDRGIFLMTRLCDVTPEFLSEMDEFDVKKLQEQLEAFRGG